MDWICHVVDSPVIADISSGTDIDCASVHDRLMTVLNKSTDPIPAGAVFIMRPSEWGNPFIIGRDGTREEVIEKYRLDLWDKIRNGSIPLKKLADLHDRDLVCCCKPKPCHGDVLAQAAVWAHKHLNR